MPEAKAARVIYHFDSKTLPQDFQWLRTPEPERIFSLTERQGHLRLLGRESIGSWFEQALVARRQEHHSFRAETVVEFEPETYQQVAGLTHYYNRHKFHALVVTLHEKLGRVVTIFSCPGDFPHGRMEFPVEGGVSIPDGPVHLAAEVRENDLQFFWRSEATQDWQAIGPRAGCRGDFRRGRARRTRILHRGLHRDGGIRHHREREAGRFRSLHLRGALIRPHCQVFGAAI